MDHVGRRVAELQLALASRDDIAAFAHDSASLARRSKSLEVLIPILYIKGISTGDFEEALVALLGKDAVGNATERLALSNVAVVGGWTP
jgi:hypothetical protein